jgi:hypothetical protein
VQTTQIHTKNVPLLIELPFCLDLSRKHFFEC